MKKLRPNDQVTVLRDITRQEGPYAKAGETGKVVEVFSNKVGAGEKSRWFAKVLMDKGDIKTFRQTSLDILRQCAKVRHDQAQKPN